MTNSGDEIVVHDISATGILVETSQSLSSGDTLEIDLPESGLTTATVVWSSGQFFGCQFASCLQTAAVSAALLRSQPLSTSLSGASGADISTLNSLLAEELADDHEAEDDRYSLRVRGLVLLGTSILSWVLAVSLFMHG